MCDSAVSPSSLLPAFETETEQDQLRLALQILPHLPETAKIDPFRTQQQLRNQGYDPHSIALAITLRSLQEQAISKFGNLNRHLLFTRDGIEQATRFIVALLHAQTFAQAGYQQVGDLGCGIGTESLALLAHHICPIAVEKDPFTASLAHYNIQVFAKHLQPQLHNTDVLSWSIPSSIEALFFDPARRSGQAKANKRLNDPAQWEPNLDWAWKTGLQAGAVGMKIAPGVDYRILPSDSLAQWVSVNNQLVECVVWSAKLANYQTGRKATLIKVNALPDFFTLFSNSPIPRIENITPQLNIYHLTQIGNPQDPVNFLPAIHNHPKFPNIETERQDFITSHFHTIFEPDKAIIRAGLLTSLPHISADYYLCSPQIAYLLCPPTPAELTELQPLGACFEILQVLPWPNKHGAKLLGNLLIQYHATSVEIKTRGLNLDPQIIRKTLNIKSTNTAPAKELTAIITRLAGKPTLFLTKRHI